MPYPTLREIDGFVKNNRDMDEARFKDGMYRAASSMFHDVLSKPDEHYNENWDLYNAMEGLLRIVWWLTQDRPNHPSKPLGWDDAIS